MFKKTTITMTLAAIATVAVNLQAPVFAAEPSTEPIITETPGLPGIDSFTLTAPTLEERLEDYLAGLGPEEDDFGGPAEVAALPDDVTAAIMDSIVDLPGLSGLPPLTIDDTEPEAAVEPDEGAELPLDPTDTCGEDGVACEFAPTVDDEGMPFDDEEVLPEESYPWDVPAADDSEIPFDDHGWVEPDHDGASPAASSTTDARTAVATSESAPTRTTVASDATTLNYSVDAAISETGEAVAEVASVIAANVEEGTTNGFDLVAAALIGMLASMAVAGLGYGAFRMGRRGA